MHDRVLQSVSSSFPTLNPRNPLSENLKFGFRHAKTLKRSSFRPKPLISKCTRNPEGTNANGGSFKDTLSGLVGKQVEELLGREENKGLLDGLEKASMRVETAKRELADIQRQELEAKMLRGYVDQLQFQASEIAECQEEILKARAMVEEAEQSLSVSTDKDSIGVDTDEAVDKDREKTESVKVALVSAVIGTFAELPISISQGSTVNQMVLPLGIAFVSCALFGITFRYAVRRDLDNFHLKTGPAAAFGFVKGLGVLNGGQELELNTESLVSVAYVGSVSVSQSILIFAFASVGLDFCFKSGLLSPFPIRRSSSEK